MEYFEIKNWKKFQIIRHDRPYRWIKLHLTLLQNYEFDLLTEVQQAHLMKIWLLAGGLAGKIPNDPTWVGRKIGAKSRVDLNTMAEVGFLIPIDVQVEKDKRWISLEKETAAPLLANVAAPLLANVASKGVDTEKRREEKRRVEKRREDTPFLSGTAEKSPEIPYEQIVIDLNEKTGKNFNPNANDTRKLIKARWNEGFTLENFIAVHDLKVQEWGSDPKMKRYLRPTTLYSGKFDRYLQESGGIDHDKLKELKKSFADTDYGETELPEWAKDDEGNDSNQA